MSQALSTVLPVSAQAADAAASLQVSPKNQAVGAQDAFTNLLLARIKESGLTPSQLIQQLSGKALTELNMADQAVQDLPESGKALPVDLPHTDLEIQVVGNSGTNDSNLDILRAAAAGDDTTQTTAEGVIDVLPENLRQLASLWQPVGDVALSGNQQSPGAIDLNGIRASLQAESTNPLDNADLLGDRVSKNNSVQLRAIEAALHQILDGDTNKSINIKSSFEQFPDLLAQKLFGKPDAQVSGLLSQVSNVAPNVNNILGQATTAYTTTNGTAQAPSMSVPLGQAEWGNELGDRVRWMVNQHVQTAELRLNPPELGPVRIHISVDQAHVSVAFTSNHAVVRDALETAMPQLRDMLSQSGLSLANGSVADQSHGGQRQTGNTTNQGFGSAVSNENYALIDDLPANIGGITRVAMGLIDQFV